MPDTDWSKLGSSLIAMILSYVLEAMPKRES
jgi:hypothetical protein